MGKGKELRGQKKKKANANLDKERVTCESTESKMCGGLGGATNQQNFWPFNFSVVMAQVSPRLACVWVDVSHYLKMLQVWELVCPNAPLFLVEKIWVEEAYL